MRTIAALLLITACASSDGTVKNEIMGGLPGQDIAVGIVDLETPLGTLDREGTRQYTVHLEVTNLIDVPLTVEKITIAPSESRSAFQVHGASRRFNEMIDPGKEHIFQIPLNGRIVRPFQPEERRVVEFVVIVALTNGDSYFYTFEGPVRDIDLKTF